MSVLLIIIVTAIIVFYFYVKKKQSFWAERGVAYVQPKFLLGNTKLGSIPNNAIKTMQDIYHKLKGKGPFGGMYLFTAPIIIPTDLDFLKSIFIKDFHHFHDRGTFVNEEDDPLTGHLFSLSGEKWRNMRNKLSPTFTSGKMKMMFPLITDIAVHFHECLANMIKEDNVIEVKDVLARFTTDVIGSCAFGLECNSLDNPKTEFRRMGNKIFEQGPLNRVKINFVLIFRNLAKRLHMKFIPADVTAFYMGIVRDTIDYREKNNVNRNDFMNLLIQLKNKGSLDGEQDNLGKLTIEQIAAQAFVFFLAGFETSSTTMMFALYNLARYPDIQEKLRAHMNDILKKHDNKISYEAVMDMNYLDQVINETLRLYPPVSNLVRIVTEDYKVPETDQIFKKDMRLFIPIYAIHHDPEIYDNPETFDPDRFSKEEVQKRHFCSFLPFGEGPRNCIGLRFGMMQTRIGLLTLLRHFKFSVCDKTPIPIEFSLSSPILSPKGGMFLKIEKL